MIRLKKFFLLFQVFYLVFFIPLHNVVFSHVNDDDCQICSVVSNSACDSISIDFGEKYFYDFTVVKHFVEKNSIYFLISDSNPRAPPASF